MARPESHGPEPVGSVGIDRRPAGRPPREPDRQCCRDPGEPRDRAPPDTKAAPGWSPGAAFVRRSA
jgi:hypothetical protein